MTNTWVGFTLGSVHEALLWNRPCGGPSIWQALLGRFVLPSPEECHRFHTSSVGGSENHPSQAEMDTATKHLWYSHVQLH